MRKIVGVILLMVGSAFALPAPPGAPEISPESGMNAVALIAGGLMVLRSGRKK
jgi:hypothetical protein